MCLKRAVQALYPRAKVRSVTTSYKISLNMKRVQKNDALFSVMIQCKSTDPESDKAFVRRVVAAPEPMAVLCTNQQLNDMVRFLTDPSQFSVMGVDPTFNFGDFNVTLIAFAICFWNTGMKVIRP